MLGGVEREVGVAQEPVSGGTRCCDCHTDAHGDGGQLSINADRFGNRGANLFRDSGRGGECPKPPLSCCRCQDARVYLAKPQNGSGSGVLVLHSWWGLNEFFRSFCDRLADHGFVALAPDLYGGKVATTISDAKRLRAAAGTSRKEPIYRYLMRMLELLSEHADPGSPVGVVGFSMGGHWAYWLAQRPELPIAATVTFYAARNGDYRQSSSAFLAHFAETDEFVSPASVGRLRKSLAEAGREATFHTYPGAGHWFFEQDRVDNFNASAAELAWERTIDFLKWRLSPPTVVRKR